MLCIGQSHYFRFNHPVEANRLKKNLSSNYHEVPKNVPGNRKYCDMTARIVQHRINAKVVAYLLACWNGRGDIRRDYGELVTKTDPPRLFTCATLRGHLSNS